MLEKKKPAGRWYRFRSAITGRFVTAAQALKAAATTVRERVRRIVSG